MRPFGVFGSVKRWPFTGGLLLCFHKQSSSNVLLSSPCATALHCVNLEGGSFHHLRRRYPASVAAVCAVHVVQVRVEDGEWVAWSDSVPKTQLEPHRIVSSDVVITTTDTVR